MATGNGGSKGRMIVLVLLLAAVAVAGWYRFGRSGGIDQVLMSGDLFGKQLEDATKLFGVQPVAQPNPDPNSTATIYLYTIASSDPAKTRRISVQVRASKITRADLVDETGKVIPFDSKN
jgi:hypothetical protein